MSFKKNEYCQMKFDDRTLSLTKRETRMLQASWAENFREIVFLRINAKRVLAYARTIEKTQKSSSLFQKISSFIINAHRNRCFYFHLIPHIHFQF